MDYELGDLVLYNYKSGHIYYGIVIEIEDDQPEWFHVLWTDGSMTMEHRQYSWIQRIGKATT